MKFAHHVIIVDSEPDIRTLLRLGLEAEGCRVSEASSQAALMRCLENDPADLITLDLSRANEDGLAIGRSIRTSYNILIIMISGRVAAEKRIVCLESVADDYIEKPFHVREVVLRICRLLPQIGPNEAPSVTHNVRHESERYAMEAGILDVPRRELRSLNGDLIKLTDAEFDLLTILVRHPNRILSRNEMMQLWKGHDWSPLDRSLDKHIARLRSKIEPLGETPHQERAINWVRFCR